MMADTMTWDDANEEIDQLRAENDRLQAACRAAFGVLAPMEKQIIHPRYEPLSDAVKKLKDAGISSQYACEACDDTGFYGDNGPGIDGNSEYHPCDYCDRGDACRHMGAFHDGETDNETMRKIADARMDALKGRRMRR